MFFPLLNTPKMNANLIRSLKSVLVEDSAMMGNVIVTPGKILQR